MYIVSTAHRGRLPNSRRVASARVNLRVDPRVKALLMRAARLQQLKLTEFMIQSSQAAAESALAERTRFVVPAEKWREFHAALDAPGRKIPSLRKLFVQPSVFETA
jgi:uncharacterized protein (DUF1778 family)